MKNGLDDLIDELEKDKPTASNFAAPNGGQNDGSTVDENRDADGQRNSSIPPFSMPDDISATSSPEQFDTNIHCVDATGNPRRNKDGSFRKKRGRKGYIPGEENEQTQKASQDLKCANAAAATTTLYVLVGMIIDPEEWKPNDNELLAINLAWKEYYIARGVKDIPPWLGVLIVTVAYIGPRVQRPRSKHKLMVFFNAMKTGTISTLKFLKLVK